jgi:hypothetical protein
MGESLSLQVTGVLTIRQRPFKPERQPIKRASIQCPPTVRLFNDWQFLLHDVLHVEAARRPSPASAN